MVNDKLRLVDVIDFIHECVAYDAISDAVINNKENEINNCCSTCLHCYNMCLTQSLNDAPKDMVWIIGAWGPPVVKGTYGAYMDVIGTICGSYAYIMWGPQVLWLFCFSVTIAVAKIDGHDLK